MLIPKTMQSIALKECVVDINITKKSKKSKKIYRNVLGTKNLGDILSERESIAHDMQVNCDDDAMMMHMMLVMR